MATAPETKKDDGGPAFPTESGQTDYFTHAYQLARTGMSMRDYFAAHAIPMATKWEEDRPTGSYTVTMEPTYAGIATRAYLLADAMLKERSKG